MSPRASAFHPTTAVALVAAVILALAGCADASSNSPAHPSTPPATVGPSMPTAAAPSPATPAPSPLPGFTTAIPPAADQPWTGITWRALTRGDPLSDVRSAVRWNGGFVAVGTPVVTDGSSRTPLWTSPDGAGWSALDPAALGTSTVVLDVVATADGLAALTLQGGSSTGTFDEIRVHGLDFLTLTPPLQVFTSSDGLRWTAGPGPDLPLQAEYGSEGWAYRPRLVAGEPGLLAYAWERPALGAGRPTAQLAVARDPALPAAPGLSSTEAQGPCRLAYSADGVAWETLPADASPAGFICLDIAPIAGGFAAVGRIGEDRAGALWSADGRTWEPATTPAPRWFPRSIAAGSGGLVALGDTGVTANVHATPGPSLSWSSTDGRAWTMLQAEGIIVADGDRLVSYRGGTRPTAWTSFDGLTWTPVAITPTTPPGLGQLLAMPIGLLWIGGDGSTWFGEPTAP
jgi:hypothetical protein